MQQPRPLTEARLARAEHAGLDMLDIVRGLMLEDLRKGRVPLTPGLRAALDVFARERDERRGVALPPTSPEEPPALRVIEGGR